VTAPSNGTTTQYFVDLHMHSTASDGALAPAAVIAAASRAQLSAIALTDHDTVDGLPEAIRAGAEAGIRVIAGVELSAVWEEKEIHLLGLHLERLDAIAGPLARFQGERHARAEQIVEKLNKQNVTISMDDVLAQSAGGAVGRPHVARALIAAGWVRDQREAFDRYLGFGRSAYVAKPFLSAGDAIAMVHEAGGIAVYAHPGGEGRRDKVEALAGQGLDGLEVRHPSHSADDIARLGALTDHFGLVPSGGSDWHGAPEGPRTIGAMKVPGEWLERQDARVASRRTPV
jgi:predicted metal-dependent phosphoesterase TrpH